MNLQHAHIIALSVLLGCSLPQVSLSQAVEAYGGMLVVEGPDHVDFGEYPASEARTAVFTVRNTGELPLRIRSIRKTCGCASATSNRDAIEPGGTASVTIMIDPYSIAGPYSKNTFIESTDELKTLLKLNTSGRAIPLVEVQPESEITAGRIALGTGWSGEVSIRRHDPGVILGPAVAGGTHSLRLSTNRIDEAGRTFTLQAVLDPSEVSGDLQGLITIPVLHPTNHPPLKITISGRIGDSLVIVPGICYLEPTHKQPQTRTFTLRMPGRRSVVIDPNAIIQPKQDGIATDFVYDPPGNLLKMTITFQPEFLTTLLVDETIRLEFGLDGAASATLVCKIRKGL